MQMRQSWAMLAAVGVIGLIGCAETDPGITATVKARLAADDIVRAYVIDVDTAEGVVTLSGTVPTAVAEDRAIRLARETDGVVEVVDEIAVNTAVPTSGELEGGLDPGEASGQTENEAERTGDLLNDAALTSSIKAKLLAEMTTPGVEIDVDAENGVVTLSGTVPSRAAADLAVSIVRRTEGVKSVVNNLRVAS
jgi:osmotically-inducible protein OsmY